MNTLKQWMIRSRFGIGIFFIIAGFAISNVSSLKTLDIGLHHNSWCAKEALDRIKDQGFILSNSKNFKKLADIILEIDNNRPSLTIDSIECIALGSSSISAFIFDRSLIALPFQGKPIDIPYKDVFAYIEKKSSGIDFSLSFFLLVVGIGLEFWDHFHKRKKRKRKEMEDERV